MKIDHYPFPLACRQIEDFLSQDECKVLSQQVFVLQEKLGFGKFDGVEGPGVASVNQCKSIFVEIDKLNLLNKSLCEIIQKEIDSYCFDFCLLPCTLDRSWVAIQKPGSHIARHFHNQSIVSGSLYLTDHDIPLVLCNPNRLQVWNSLSNKRIDHEYHNIYNKKGSLFLFPGYLEHQSGIVKNDVRIVFAFTAIKSL
jgi:hypothetical protein